MLSVLVFFALLCGFAALRETVLVLARSLT